MQNRYAEIIIALDEQIEWISSKELAFLLGYSQSSIKNYVQDINTQKQNTIISSNLGYKLNPTHRDSAYSIFVSNEERDLNSITHRRKTILFRLLNITNKINVFDLCEDLFISLTTLKSDVRYINEDIDKYQVKIRQFGYEIELIGEEANKRKLFIDSVYEDSNSNIISRKTIQELFLDIDLVKIDNLISSQFNTNEIYADEYAYLDILLHISLMIERIKSNQFLTHGIQTKVSDEKLHSIANELSSDLSKLLSLTFSHHETNEIYLLLLSKTSSLKHQKLTSENIHDYVSPSTIDLIDEIIDFLSEFYNIDLLNDLYYVPFVLHISNLLLRIEANHYLKNPLVNNLKSGHPFVYQLSVSISDIISKRTKKIIPNDEIGYIALHLGGSFAKENKRYHRIIAALITPSAKSLPLQLKKKIEDTLGEFIYIERIYTSFDETVDVENYDIIITTINLNTIIDKIPVVMISPLFELEDQHRFFSYIENINIQRQYKKFISNITLISDSNYFMINSVLNNRNEVIDVVSDILINEKIVNDNFSNNVKHRELLSSTAFHKIAIPHTLVMDAHKSKMYIILSEKPIDWDKQQVNLVFLFAINEKDKHIFYTIFEILSIIYSNPTNVLKSLQCKNYNDFIKFITDVNVLN